MSKKTKVQKFDSIKRADKIRAKWQQKIALMSHNRALELTDRIIEHGQRKKTTEPVPDSSDNETS
jgi:predicted DNA-binding protein YlxM (UPF0122 family)